MSNVITLPECAINWPKLFKAEPDPSGRLCFSAELIFDPGTDLTALKQAIQATAQAKWPQGLPTGLEICLRKAEAKAAYASVPWFAGRAITNCKSREDYPPQVVDSANQPFVGTVESGRRVRVAVRPYAYEKAGNRGVALGLIAVQVLGKGDPIPGSTPDAESLFGAPSAGGADAGDFDWG